MVATRAARQREVVALVTERCAANSTDHHRDGRNRITKLHHDPSLPFVRDLCASRIGTRPRRSWMRGWLTATARPLLPIRRPPRPVPAIVLRHVRNDHRPGSAETITRIPRPAPSTVTRDPAPPGRYSQARRETRPLPSRWTPAGKDRGQAGRETRPLPSRWTPAGKDRGPALGTPSPAG
jgi:hypothetical protein